MPARALDPGHPPSRRTRETPHAPRPQNASDLAHVYEPRVSPRPAGRGDPGTDRHGARTPRPRRVGGRPGLTGPRRARAADPDARPGAGAGVVRPGAADPRGALGRR